jgi:hypothetical protein
LIFDFRKEFAMNPDDVQGSEETREVNPAEQLAQANEKIARMSRDLDELQLEQKLTHKLAAAGAVDLETAVLVAKARMDGKTQAEVDACVAQLKKEKAYLFGGPTEAAASRKTAPAKDRVAVRSAALEQAAQKAARTGSRMDLHHYLKLRRNLL